MALFSETATRDGIVNFSISSDLSLIMFIDDGGFGYPLSIEHDEPLTLLIPLYSSWPSNTTLTLPNNIS